MHQNDEADFKRALDAAFGMWKDRGIDGVEYQRELRAEWERDWSPSTSVDGIVI